MEMMQHRQIRYIGLDVHKASIAVAIKTLDITVSYVAHVFGGGCGSAQRNHGVATKAGVALRAPPATPEG